MPDISAPTFTLALRFLREWEGGFVDDPRDPGGATKYGISLRFLRTLAPELGDRDGDGDVDADDVLGLSWEDAAALYRREFWEPLIPHDIPARVALAMFDASVNLGRRRAVMMLQKALLRLGSWPMVVDGLFGPATRAGAKLHGGGYELAAQMTIMRTWCYCDVVRKNATLGRYLAGWCNRTLAMDELLRSMM